MGVVTSATDRLLKREVAQKHLKTDAPNLLRELFIREAQTLASLQHPNIPPIYDLVLSPPSESSQGSLSFTMEKVEGVSLSHLIHTFHHPKSGRRKLAIMGFLIAILSFLLPIALALTVVIFLMRS